MKFYIEFCMKTLVECIEILTKDGFTENFVVENEMLFSADKKNEWKPEAVKIVNFYRFEGASDPADNSILYAIEASKHKGILIDAYGAYSNAEISKFIQQVENISKKEHVDQSSKTKNR
jgi:hypothetical protein